MITKLTAEQKLRMIEFINRWISIGLCTDPADRPRAKNAIIESYRQGGLKPPEKIVWCGSPLSAELTRTIILDKKLTKLEDNVRESVRESVGESVGQSVEESVRQSVEENIYGQHDASWLVFYDYFREVIGLENQTEKLRGLFEWAQSAGWGLPHKNICWVSERHNSLTSY